MYKYSTSQYPAPPLAGAKEMSAQTPLNSGGSEMSVQSSPNIAVVGGGIVGASIAWHLSHEANVTIVAEDIGGTATPNSFAWLNAAAGNRKPHSSPFTISHLLRFEMFQTTSLWDP